jgi:multiple antibiotic resistance protein
MIETASVALATFFATVGPLDVAMIFAALTARQKPRPGSGWPFAAL